MKIYPPKIFPAAKDAVFFKLSDEEFDILNKEIVEIQEKIIHKNDTELKKIEYNNKLAGHIRHQYSLSVESKNYLQEILKPVVTESVFKQNRPILLSDQNIVLCNSLKKDDKCWVNFQKKYEFNPVHHHSGYLSFVIWMKIPYLMEEENKHENIIKKDDISENINGDFQFIYANEHGVESVALRVDNRWEKRGVMFPSNLSHIVYPFYTSDDYRISISGNFWIK